MTRMIKACLSLQLNLHPLCPLSPRYSPTPSFPSRDLAKLIGALALGMCSSFHHSQRPPPADFLSGGLGSKATTPEESFMSTHASRHLVTLF